MVTLAAPNPRGTERTNQHNRFLHVYSVWHAFRTKIWQSGMMQFVGTQADHHLLTRTEVVLQEVSNGLVEVSELGWGHLLNLEIL
jgi:hypothetical protein